MSWQQVRNRRMLMLAPLLLGVAVIGRLYPADWSEANAQGAQPAAEEPQYNPEPPNIRKAMAEARDVYGFQFPDRYPQYRGSWVRFSAGSLRCVHNRDGSNHCFDNAGRIAVIIGFRDLKKVETNGDVSDVFIGAFGYQCKPMFYFNDIVPTTNPNVIGVDVDTLYCVTPPNQTITIGTESK